LLGRTNPQEPVVAGPLAVLEQLTYFQSRYAVSAEPAAYNPIQSDPVGDTIPAHVAVTDPPADAEVGLAVIVGRAEFDASVVNPTSVEVVMPPLCSGCG
jgi:hypothetical protein